ncbi:MAG: hypothetical protein ACTSRL_13880 [Candidatus Helarchaeota archaeon]
MGKKELEEATRLFHEGDIEASIDHYHTALWYFKEIHQPYWINFINEKITELEQLLQQKKEMPPPEKVVTEPPKLPKKERKPLFDLFDLSSYVIFNGVAI